LDNNDVECSKNLSAISPELQPEPEVKIKKKERLVEKRPASVGYIKESNDDEV
jgi:hypothetical protein